MFAGLTMGASMPAVQSFQMWRDNAAYQKAQKRATQEVNQAIMRAAMVFWRDYHVYHAIK
jgi:hypothetical protein